MGMQVVKAMVYTKALTLEEQIWAQKVEYTKVVKHL